MKKKKKTGQDDSADLRKGGEEALRENDVDLTALVENTKDRIWAVDADYRLIVHSSQILQGVRKEQKRKIALGESVLLDSLPQAVQDEWRSYYDRALRGESFSIEKEIQFCKELVLIDYRFRPIRSAEGKISGVVVSGCDITERKRAEVALQDSEVRFRELFNHMSSGVAVYVAIDNGGDFIFRDFNPAAEKIEKISRKDVLGKRVSEAFPGVKAFGLFEVMQRVWQTGISEYFPDRLYKDDRNLGGWRENWVFKLPTGEIVTVYNDITERKRAEEALRESEERVTKAFRSIPDALVISRLEDGKIVEVNNSWHKLFGYSREEVIGKSSLALNLFADLADRQRAIALLREQGFVRDFELQIRQKSGALRTAILSVEPLEIQGEQYLLTVAQDITERKRAERMLESQHALLAALINSSKDTIIFSLDRDYCYTAFNEKNREEMKHVWNADIKIGMNLLDCMQTPELRELARQSIDRALRGESFSEIQHQPVPDINYEISWNPIVQHKEVVGVTVFIRDITERKQAEEKLRESEKKYRELYDFLPIPVYEMDLEANVTAVNRAIIETFRGTEDDFKKGFNAWKLLSPEDVKRSVKNIQRLLNGEEVEGTEYNFTRLDGSVFPAIVISSVIYRQDRPVGVRGAIIDITERRKAEEMLIESEKRFRELVELLPQIVFETDAKGNLTFANQLGFKSFGYSLADFQSGINIFALVAPEDRESIKRRLMEILGGAETAAREFQVIRKDGGRFPVLMHANAILINGVPIGVRGIAIDITERKQAEDAVQASLREKEILLREIHHRVKNNMQIISSLFNLQAGHIKDENARRMLKEGQLRIRSMALVHEKLYQSRDLSKIDFADYLRTLSDHLFQFFRVEADRIRLETDLEDVKLDINSAVPCGLLVSELITNALKHAFPGGRKGVIWIRIRRRNDSAVEVRVADDGVGFSEQVDFRKTESLGLQIVNLLIGQLEGTIELDRKKGTAFTIVFRELGYKTRT